MRPVRLSVACFLLGSLIASTATAATEATEVKIIPGKAPGAVTFDATELKLVLEIPDKPRKFHDMWELGEFLDKTLNAEPVFDEKGDLVAMRGQATVLDEPCFPDPDSGRCLPVDSPVLAFIGGRTGLIEVAGEMYCLDDRKCEGVMAAATPQAAAPIEDVTEFTLNGKSGEFKIEGRSYVAGHYYREVGTWTKQIAGGYKRFEEICEWWFFFTYCWAEHGWNNMKTETFYTDKSGYVMSHPAPRWCHNCNRVTQYLWGITLERSMPDQVPWTVRGVYGWHWAEGTGGSASAGSCAVTGCYYGP